MRTTAGTVLDRPDKSSPALTEAELAALIPIVDRTRAPRRIPAPRAPKDHEAPTARLPVRRRRTWITAIVATLVAGGLAAAALLMPTGEGEVSAAGPMGLTQQAWQEYRAGERAGIGDVTLMGLTNTAWQQHRAGERAGVVTVALTGLSQDAWQQYRAGEVS